MVGSYSISMKPLSPKNVYCCSQGLLSSLVNGYSMCPQYGCFHTRGLLFVGVPVIRGLLSINYGLLRVESPIIVGYLALQVVCKHDSHGVLGKLTLV